MSKKTFTLLEMMIALLILSLIGTAVAVQVKKMIQAHQFETEVADLFLILQEAQILSAAYQTDLALDLTLAKGKMSYWFSTDEPLPSSTLSQKSKTLPHVGSCQFNRFKKSTLHFDIYSGGRIEPIGVLAFYSTLEEQKPLFFDLQASPLVEFKHYPPEGA